MHFIARIFDKLIVQPFTQHPQSVGETYIEHMLASLGFAIRLLIAGLACVIHAILPFLCVTTGSAAVNRLHAKMVCNRNQQNSEQAD